MVLKTMRDRDIPEDSDELVLIERTTPQAVREWQLSAFHPNERPKIAARFRRPPEEEFADLVALMTPGDELWRCRSRMFDPWALLGDEGVAIVRNGKPIRYRALIQY
jgi:hypothetical protein